MPGFSLARLNPGLSKLRSIFGIVRVIEESSLIFNDCSVQVATLDRMESFSSYARPTCLGVPSESQAWQHL